MTINTATYSDSVDIQQIIHLAEVVLKNPHASSIVAVLFSLYIVFQVVKIALKR